jgi:hypothetical protein
MCYGNHYYRYVDRSNLMKKIAAIVCAIILAFSFSACDDTTTTDAPSDPGGQGLTYNGKPGYDMGGGLVLPYDGSGIQPGFGY